MITKFARVEFELFTRPSKSEVFRILTKTDGGDTINKRIRVNEGIRTKEVRLIDDDGKQLGIVPVREALQIATEKGYDLVEVAPNAAPPVCRVMDFGKYKYQLSKKQTSKKTSEVKEAKVSPRISAHDLQLKVKNVKRFLDDGNKAKITMFFRGREIVRPNVGMKIFERIIELLDGKFTMERPPKLEGKSIIMVISPGNK